MAWKNTGGWSKALGPYIQVGDLEEASGSWLQSGAGHCGHLGSKLVHGRALCFCLSAPVTVK